jgi:type IV secretion system protein VirB2
MKHKLKFFLATLFLSLSVIMAPTPAAAAPAAAAPAAGNTDFGDIGAKLCTIVRAITGKIGRAIATIAVIFLGFGAFFGKVTWGLAVAVAIGIFAIFGAATIVTNFGGSAATADCNNSA